MSLRFFYCQSRNPYRSYQNASIQKQLLAFTLTGLFGYCYFSKPTLADASAVNILTTTPSKTTADVEFPTIIRPINSSSTLSLVGLGLRTVSIFSIRVYVAGFYASDNALQHCKRTWHSFDRSKLLQSSATTDNLRGEALMEDLLSQPYEFGIRIHPTRQTDFSHWRDAFNRSISNQMKEALKTNTLSEQAAEEVAASLDDLKACFPNASAPKGEPLLLLRKSDGTLCFEYHGKTLGTINNRWTAQRLIQAYFADKNVISQKLKDSVAEGFEQFLMGTN